MALKLLFFASCAQWAGRRSLDLELDAPATLEALLEREPALRAVAAKRAVLKVAVNEEYAEYTTEVRDGDEVAFLPPVCGG